MKVKKVTREEVIELMEEMKQVANDNPLYVGEMILRLTNKTGPHQRHTKLVSFENVPIKCCLTLDVFGGRRMYHLSCGSLSKEVIPQNIIDLFCESVFPDSCFEVPSAHGSIVRQFLGQA